VDATEVIVVRPPADEVEVLCGGHPMIDASQTPAGDLAAAAGEGTLMGKRYTSEASRIELLVTKPGSADLAVDGITLAMKEAKPLPASD
jgi:hypothetical protein